MLFFLTHAQYHISRQLCFASMYFNTTEHYQGLFLRPFYSDGLLKVEGTHSRDINLWRRNNCKVKITWKMDLWLAFRICNVRERDRKGKRERERMNYLMHSKTTILYPPYFLLDKPYIAPLTRCWVSPAILEPNVYCHPIIKEWRTVLNSKTTFPWGQPSWNAMDGWHQGQKWAA